MNRSSTVLGMVGLLLGVGAGPSGCAPNSEQETPNGPPAVTVSVPLAREVTDYEDYTGRTAAVDSLEVRARVSGYLVNIKFKEGTEVKKGDLLDEIDPRPYRAVLDQTEAQVRLNEAQLKYQQALYERDVSLVPSGAVTREDVQKDLAARDTARAQVNAAKAAVAQAKLNLDFTKIQAPIAGRVGRTLITRGNLVVADQTLLTTVVSLDPMYAYFDVDEPTTLRIQKLIREGKFKSARTGGRPPVFLGLADERGHPHGGYVDFVNNQLDPGTATLQVRGIFANPKPPVGDRLLSPGMFVRIRVSVGPPFQALLVTQAAVGTDQDLKFIYVVNDQNKVVRHNVELGSEQDGLQVIARGLKPGERVIVQGIQHVHQGIAVKPRLVAMPVPPTGALPPTPPAVLKDPIPPKR